MGAAESKLPPSAGEWTTQVRDPARATRGMEAEQDRRHQAGSTQAGDDWFVAHSLQVCGLSESKGGRALYALGHLCPRPACSVSPLPSWGPPSV